MSKTAISQYSATPSSNSDVDGIDISEGCPASNLNNAQRSLMSHLKEMDDGTSALTSPSMGQLNVDNLRLDGNTISSTDTNGDISLSPNGTGDVVVASDNLLISNVGGVGVNSTDNIFINATNTGIKLLDDEASVIPCQSGGSNNDNALDLGFSTVRWKDLYLSGSVYIGGTAAANALDDYEQGTFTATCANGVALNSSADTLSYIKVGNHVTIIGEVLVSGDAGAQSLIINNLPFARASLSENAEEGAGSARLYNVNCAGSGIGICTSITGTNSCRWEQSFDNAASQIIPARAGGYYRVGISYRST